MTPKKFLIRMSIPKGLELSPKDIATLEKGFKTVAVRVVKARRGSSSNVNVINSNDINVVNVGGPTSVKKKKSSAKAKTTSKKK